MLAGGQQMPDESSFLAKNARHVGSLRFASHRFSEESSFLVQCAVAEDPFQGVVIGSKPGCLQHDIQTLAVVVHKDATEVFIQFWRYGRRPRRHIRRAVVADAEDVGNVQSLAYGLVSAYSCLIRQRARTLERLRWRGVRVLVSIGALSHGRIHWHAVVLRLARVHSRGRGGSKRRVNGVEVALSVVPARGRCSRRVTCRRSWSVALRHWTVGESSRRRRGSGRNWGS